MYLLNRRSYCLNFNPFRTGLFQTLPGPGGYFCPRAITHDRIMRISLPFIE